LWFAHDRAPSDHLPRQVTCRPSGQGSTVRQIWSCF
jgi:hypothetical protein